MRSQRSLSKGADGSLSRACARSKGKAASPTIASVLKTWISDNQAQGGRFFWCQSVSGEVYEVTLHGCNCPDAEYRCREAGIR